jgi:hypothetical protein
MGRIREWKSRLQERKETPCMEELRTLSAFTVLCAWLAMVMIWSRQSNFGVKNTPRYLREVLGWIVRVSPFPQGIITVHGWVP